MHKYLLRLKLRVFHKDALVCGDFLKDNQAWGYHYDHAVKKFGREVVDRTIRLGLAEPKDSSGGVIIGDWQAKYKELVLTEIGAKAARTEKEKKQSSDFWTKHITSLVVGLIVTVLGGLIIWGITGTN